MLESRWQTCLLSLHLLTIAVIKYYMVQEFINSRLYRSRTEDRINIDCLTVQRTICNRLKNDNYHHHHINATKIDWKLSTLHSIPIVTTLYRFLKAIYLSSRHFSS